MKQLVVLGGHPLNAGFIEVAARLDAQLCVVDWHEHIGWLPADAQHIQCDIKEAGLVNQLQDTPLLFCYSSSDIAAHNVARINQAHGLAAPAEQAINGCIFKDLIYQNFQQAAVLGRNYLCLDETAIADQAITQQHIHDFLHQHPSCVLKPTNSSSSRGVCFYHHTDASTVFKTAKRTQEQFGANVLLDAYIPGDEYSIEMLVDDQGHVAVWPIGLKCKSIHDTSEAISVKVIYNPPLDKTLRKTLNDMAIACAQACNIRNTLLHLELKVAPDGHCYPMEIACRSSGFVATHCVDLVSHTSYLESYLRVLQGECITPGPVADNGNVATYFFFDYPEGMVTQTPPDACDFFHQAGFDIQATSIQTLTPGQSMQRHLDDGTKKAYCILTCTQREDIQHHLERTEKAFYDLAIEACHV